MNSCHQQRCRGFTLLEVMLAVTILAVVMMSVYATWSAGLSGWKRTTGVSDNFQRLRVVMSALDDLTKSLVYQPSASNLYAVQHEHDPGLGDSVGFVTASDLLLPPAEASLTGMRRVTVGLQRDEQGRPFLGIASQPALEVDDDDSGPVWRVLSAEVCGFAARFRDPRNGTWVDKWEEANLLPSAIEYTVAFGTPTSRQPPIIVTRGIEVPVAQYALQLLGQRVTQQNTEHEVRQQADIKIVDPPGGGGDE